MMDFFGGATQCLIKDLAGKEKHETNLLSKFGKENITSSNLKPPSTSKVHTTTGAVPIQNGTTSQHIHSGRYTIHKSKLIEHISDDSEEEFNITQGNIHIGPTYNDIGDLFWQCNHCKAMMWYDERINKCKQTKNLRIKDILDEEIIIGIKNMLDNHNRYASKFRMVRDKLQSSAVCDLNLKLISDKQSDGRLYNLPNTAEVVTLIFDLFLTLTCNPTWPKIQRKVRKSNLTPHDCPDVVSRIFKMKLNQLMNDLKSGHVFGGTVGFVYTIEWKKRGLSHAHILIFLHPSNKYPNPEDFDNIISAEISNKDTSRIDGTQTEVHDEIKHYLDCRYVSPPEACWKIFAFPMHGCAPAVEPWMDSNKIYHHGWDLTYAEYVSKFVYVARKRCWQPRKQGNTIGRLIWVSPSSGELFYMRMMFSSTIGSQSYKDIRTVENVVYHTFREACFGKGFLGSDQEFVGALREANTWGTPHFVRKLFVKLLFMNTMDRPEYVWKQTWQWMANDIAFNHRRQGYAANPHRNKLIYNEMAYDKEILAAEFNKCYHSLIVASSGIASLLLPGGRTTHSKFVIPVPATQNSTCNIHQGSDLAELLHMTKLIIWDEAPMCHKFSFEALDKSLKDIMHNNRPFGG
ncbi:hypothetical protein GmHk_15G044338 [Glycine max]|nr:hypothetical protein GmHk_15G044338 [Glycine max]